ncbi:MAG: DUF1016 N-terminal domain-containing protein [Eubacteriales bacterium]|nr:DUF1016 N-terminal domain-containing protein [Eubacteriales bacterium]
MALEYTSGVLDYFFEENKNDGKGFTKSQRLLSWSHYAVLLQVNDKKARAWYEKEAAEQTWSVRTLQRNISSQYYYRILQTQKKDILILQKATWRKVFFPICRSF